MKQVMVLSAVLVLLALGSVPGSAGSSYSLKRGAVGGLETGNGGSFALKANAGLPEAGVLSGGSVRLSGGFFGQSGSAASPDATATATPTLTPAPSDTSTPTATASPTPTSATTSPPRLMRAAVGGAGPSAGGSILLKANFGQPEAGVLINGPIKLSGGFFGASRPAAMEPATATSTATATPSTTQTASPTPTPEPSATPVEDVPAVLRGSIQLQARGAAPNARWVAPLTVTLHSPGVTTPTYLLDALSDPSGWFTATDILPALYDVRIQKSRSLTSARANLILIAGLNVVDFGVLLEGDATEDGAINSLDYALLATAYFKTPEQAGFDGRADFNDDGRINAPDYAVLAANYFRRSGFQP